MGLTRAGLNRFRARIDETLREVFPCVLLISGKRVDGSGPGGRVVSDFENGGLATDYRFPFRVPASDIGGLEVGTSVDWVISATRTLKLEISEVPERPHEGSIGFNCKKRREV